MIGLTLNLDVQHKTRDCGATCNAFALHRGGDWFDSRMKQRHSLLRLLKVGPTAAMSDEQAMAKLYTKKLFYYLKLNYICESPL